MEQNVAKVKTAIGNALKELNDLTDLAYRNKKRALLTPLEFAGKALENALKHAETIGERLAGKKPAAPTTDAAKK